MMRNTQIGSPPEVPDLPNGAGAAAVLAAGVGCLLVALLALAADRSAAVRELLNFYPPTGPLSGVTTTATAGWLACWAGLDLFWRKRDVALAPVCVLAVILLVLSVLLTFPPLADLF